jgi:hypothetical protein
VAIDTDSATYTLRTGPEMVIGHFDEQLTLEPGVPVVEKLRHD